MIGLFGVNYVDMEVMFFICQSGLLSILNVLLLGVIVNVLFWIILLGQWLRVDQNFSLYCVKFYYCENLELIIYDIFYCMGICKR